MLILFVSGVTAQVNPDTVLMQRIETKDGNEFIGTITYEDSEHIKILTENLGEITIPVSFIKSREKFSPARIKEGKAWVQNYQDARYFWCPNGYGLNRGEAYYQNIWLFYNQVSYGVTRNFSVGAGIIPLFLIAGTPTPVWIVPKVSIPVVKNKFNMGVGALVGTVLGAEKSTFGILFGTGTFGSRDNNVTLGIGYGFVADGWAEKPMINLSGMFRLSPKTYLLSENYYINADGENILIFILGGRTITKRIGIDYGLLIPTSIGKFIAIPWLGLTVPLSKGRSK